MNDSKSKCLTQPSAWLLTTIKTIVSKDVDKLEPLHTVNGNAKWYNCYRKQQDNSSKKRERERILTYDLATPLLGICPKNRDQDARKVLAFSHSL